jgi:ribose/xylose/arabinose/galactoside ABC-type transport system permease subunit
MRVLGLAGVYLFVAALVAVGWAISPGFLSPESLLAVGKDVAILGIVAVGVSFVTLSGHYVDLSIPAIMAVAGIAAVYALPYGIAAALAAGLGAGGALGCLNGIMVGYLRLNPILWTLGAMAVIDGTTRWAYGGKWVYVAQDTGAGAAFAALYRAEPWGVPLIVLLCAAVALAADFVMRRTGFGRQLKLTGAAYEPARLSGIDVRRVVMRSFALCGLAAALAGILKTSFSMYGDVEIGLTYDFQAVTAVVLGGVTLAGGRGGIPGVIGGVLVMGLLGRILPLVPGVGQDEQYVIRGAIFVAVVGVQMYALRRAGRSDA